MATLIATADGNLTGSTTFAAAEAGAGALQAVRGTSTFFSAASSFTSSTFTVTNGKIIDGVVLWTRPTTAGATGTFKVDLQKGGVSQASVTVNKTDLPDSSVALANIGPTFFKFTSTATGDGGSNWTLVVTTTGTVTVTYWYVTTNTNFTRALRTTTTATPAAADDLYIVGELTGAGTKNTRTVTMDSTAATVYGNGAINTTAVAGGGIHISNWGTLTYAGAGGTTLATLDGVATNATLSNGNLTVTHSNTSAGGGRSTMLKTSGKYYFEVTLTSRSGDNDSIAISTATTTHTSILTGTGGFAVLLDTTYWGSFNLFTNGSNAVKKTDYPIVNGDIICVAVDMDNKKVWARRNGGQWNSATGNPATNTDGVDLLTAGGHAPMLTFDNPNSVAGDNMTANFGATAYAYTPPSGFGNWGTTAASGGNYLLRVAGDVIVYQYGTLNMGSSAGPPASTAVLEFQPVSADGDFGLRCLDNSTVTITGQPRTAGKNVVQCKLTADVAGNSVGTIVSASGTSSVAAIEASGNSLLAIVVSDNASNISHSIYVVCTSITNTTQVATAWLARGSGTNNRYVRIFMGDAASASAITTGFYSDIDLQAGTAGTVTAIGTGTATSVSITPVGTGYLVKMTGKVSASAATVRFHICSCAVAGTIVYVGNATQCFIADHINVVTAPTIPDTTFNVDIDTGWLSGDAVCVASTTRTATECEIYPLNANAGASSFTSALYPFGTGGINAAIHHGTAPIQAEIGLLTRNVKIRSTSPTLMSYVYCTALATVTASWAEFYYIGASGSQKRGIEIDAGAVANPKSFTYCSVHDCDTYGVFCAGSPGVSLNAVISNNVIWNVYGNTSLVIASTITNTDWVIDSNLLMRNGSGSNMIGLLDAGGTVTNNTMVGATNAANYGLLINEPAAVLGTMHNNTTHSSAGLGMVIQASYLKGTISNFTAWRCVSNGIAILTTTDSLDNLVFLNPVLFGNASPTQTNFSITRGNVINIVGGLIAGDTLTQTGHGITLGSNYDNPMVLNMTSVDMSGVGGIFVPHKLFDINTNATTLPVILKGLVNNCKFGAPSLLDSKLLWDKGNYLGFQKYNQTSGDHRTEMTYGQLRTDSVIYHTAAPSMRMTPNNASAKLESAPKDKGMLVAVASGAAVTASVWVRKDATYTGSQPRLIVRANAAIGIGSDTVLAACTDVTTSPTPAIWDGTTLTNVTLSDGGLVTTNTLTAQTNQGAHLHAAHGQTSGKYYFEVTLTTLVAGQNVGIGVGTTTATYSGMGGSGVGGAIFWMASGNVYANGSSQGISAGGRSTGNVIGVAVDLNNRTVWWRVSPAGSWNASGAANPATNTGGVPLLAGTIVPFVVFGGSGGLAGNVFTANFGATAFTGTVPSGFTSVWPTAITGSIGTATWVQLSGTTPSATDDGAVELIVDCDGASGFINVDDWAAS